MDDSETYFYEEDFDDAGLLSAVHEAEASKRQKMNASECDLGSNVIHVKLPEVLTGWAQQTGMPARPTIRELPQTPASGRSHSNMNGGGGSGRPRSEGRMVPPTATASDPSATLSLVPILAPQREHRVEVEHTAQRGNVQHGQSYGQNSRPPDSQRAGQQQNASHLVPDNQLMYPLVLPSATPPPPASPQPPSWQASGATDNSYFVTHPPATSRPSTSYQQPHTPQPGNQRLPLQQVSENRQVPGALALVDRKEARPQVVAAGGQENVPAAPPAKKKELWLDCPRASVFRSFQDEAMQILDPCDYQMLQGKRMIKKTGWRKLGMFFGVNYEIKDFRDETDQNGDIVRSRFWVKAIMPNGRYCEATGSCDANEKRFSKPNNDIPATAETRAKTRAVQDLLGIGEWKSHQ
ncbi:hypothetical protein KFL_000220310 [Klebsormidium nitens]|uniref:Uncharacterized protein n=1 Tax=Klebsormidium nitens TaxID=105231 RepID=A0A1Y1HKA0_KLENI|nr:hypothetical protein KFL_000220310 [Klebsormidium nitens]|eukprot:GAQ79000.1 hypothetical protein KFL_000220310 [Klebsormidium nitens]